MMSDKQRFLRDVKKLFPVYEKQEKEIINGLKNQMENLGNCDYLTLVEEFGEPTDIISSYYEGMKTEILIHKLEKKKYLKLLVYIIIICIVSVSLFETWRLNQLYDEFRENQPVEVETIIE
jgi:AAA+ ATPase superfamily predicted ATPase